MQPSAVLHEIAEYIRTSSDMYSFLISMPQYALPEPFNNLLEFYIANQSLTCPTHNCGCRGKKICLWPCLTVPCSTLEQMAYNYILKCLPLYSTITLPFASKLASDVPSTIKIISSEDVKSIEDIYLLNEKPFHHISCVNLKVHLYMGLEPESLFLAGGGLKYFTCLEKIVVTWDYIRDGGEHSLLGFLQNLVHIKTLISFGLTTSFESNIMWTREMTEALVNWSNQGKPKTIELGNLLINDELHFSHHFKSFAGLLPKRQRFIEINDNLLNRFRANDITPNEIEGMKYINPQALELRFKHFGSNPSRENMTLFINTMTSMSNLRNVHILVCVLTIEHCEQITRLLPQLTELVLFRNRLNDECASLLAKALPRCQRLETFTLRSQELTSLSAKAIANALLNGAAFRKLNLRSNKIKNEGVIALSQVIHYLEVIDLGYNQIGFEGALAISKIIPKTSHMKSIKLHGNLLTAQGVGAITTSLNQCKLRFGKVKLDH